MPLSANLFRLESSIQKHTGNQGRSQLNLIESQSNFKIFQFLFFLSYGHFCSKNCKFSMWWVRRSLSRTGPFIENWSNFVYKTDHNYDERIFRKIIINISKCKNIIETNLIHMVLNNLIRFLLMYIPKLIL